MSQWIERIDSHPLHEQMRTLDSVLDELDEFEDPSEEGTHGFERLRQINALVQSRISSLDPFLFPLHILDSLSSSIQEITSQVEQYTSSRDLDHLNNANQEADTVLVDISNLPVIRGLEDVQGLREAATSFRGSVAQYQRYVEDEQKGLQAPIQSLQQRLEQLNTEIENQRGRLDSAIAEFQKQFSEAEERRRNEHGQEEKQRASGYVQAQTERAETFRANSEEWQKTYQNLKDEIAKAHETLTEKHGSSIQELESNFTQSAEVYMQELESHKERAQELVYVIANTGMVGGYQKIANEERRSANRWHVITIGSLLCLIGFAIYAFASTIGEEVKIATFLGRAFVAVTFGILAAYAARQADRHQEIERNSRRVELALASIDPYLAGLPDDTLQEVKKDLAQRFFGQQDSERAKRKEKFSGNAADLLRMTVEALVDIAKKSGK